ncbi:MAG TPA: ABC transporter permease [Bacillota bacterium]|nr:ABC transporter permease [Bacillota bacterium]HOK64290.1 ABC transporter permease [Bacillota bacterium]HOL11908.1 ABC transporter permease [Bacillota bacterium]HPP60671.1 ABC transporter permease [Bacillota bacterium]HPV13142.1 ABC transporter permease [Bacillota bacterium]
MRISDLFSVSLRGLTANKMRSALTMLGVIIGVASVIALVSVGEGARREVVANFESIGTNILKLYVYRWDARLTVEDLADLKQRVPGIDMIMPDVRWWPQITYEGKERWGEVSGVTEIFPEIRSHDLYSGRFFTAVENEIARPVAVIGWQVMQELFAGRDPRGKYIYLDREPFEIVGVLDEKGENLGEGVDRMIFVPITVAQKRRGTNKVDEVYIKAVDQESIPMVQLTLERIFEAKYGPDSVYIWSQQSMLEELQKSTRIMTLMLGAIAGVSLLVGGIGVMNIMLVAVSERTREIGLRKALGAKRSHILLQFLIESALLCSLGGIVGIIVGVGGSQLLAKLGPKTAVSPASIVIAFSFSVLVGFVFGVYPAMRAGSLEPVEALRTE